MNSKDVLFQMRELASIIDAISKTICMGEEKHRQLLVNYASLEKSYDLLIELYRKSIEGELILAQGIIDYKKDKERLFEQQRIT